MDAAALIAHWEARLAREGMPAEIRLLSRSGLILTSGSVGHARIAIGDTDVYGHWSALGSAAHRFPGHRRSRRFLVRYCEVGSVTRVCRELRIPRETAYKWLRKFALWRAENADHTGR